MLPAFFQRCGAAVLGQKAGGIHHRDHGIQPGDIGQAAANIYRDVNGVLRTVGGATPFQKYRSSISCKDMRPVAVNGVWPGKLVTVQCIATLGYLTAMELPARSVVPGSSFVEGDWTFYRPELSMMVLSWSLEEAEYEGAISWSMELEEV
jgi:hypothetical protein